MDGILRIMYQRIIIVAHSILLLSILIGLALLLKPIFQLGQLIKKLRKKGNVVPEPIILQVSFPQEKSQKASSFSEILSTLHSLLLTKDLLGRSKKNFFSLEMASFGSSIYFFLVVPKAFQRAVESQIYAYYPNVEINLVDDYTKRVVGNLKPEFAELKLKYQEIIPIKSVFSIKEKNDPLNKIAAFLSRAESKDQFWLQISLYPESNQWYWRGWPAFFFHLKRLSGNSRTKAIENKLNQKLFRAKIRLIYWAKEKDTAQAMLNGILNIFKEFAGYNKFTKIRLFPPVKKKFFLELYRSRVFAGNGYLLSPQEIAIIYHYPSKQLIAPNIPQLVSKRGAPPDKLPLEGQHPEEGVTIFGETNFRNELKRFGIKRTDRQRHLYIIGKTGMGKSKLLEIMMIADLKHQQGLTLIDPHGETAEAVIKYIPKERIKDTIYFNPTDRDFPIAFNILETTYDTQKRHLITNGFIAIFQKLFWNEWSPRMEQLTRHTVMALLETPNSSILAIPKMLTDKEYRQKIIAQIQDPIVKNFWTQEFMSWSDRFANDSIVPLLNKIGQFLSNPLIRNCVGRLKNNVDFEKILNQGKIFIANLSKGQLGEENSALLGSMIITKIQEAALSRAKIPEKERRDHYLYIDEFQNFATAAFNILLSEARKYHLNLTIAHQFVGQLNPEVKKTIFGNVSSIIAFRVGGEDAVILEKEFSPAFRAQDFLNLSFREMYLKLSIDGETAQPFSARTIDLLPPEKDLSREVIHFTRRQYAQPRNIVENEINQIVNNYGLEQVTSEKFDEPIV